MSLFWERLIKDVSRTMESRCNNIRAECGLDMATGEELCHAEICAFKCPMKPFHSTGTIKEAHELHKSLSGVAE